MSALDSLLICDPVKRETKRYWDPNPFLFALNSTRHQLLVENPLAVASKGNRACRLYVSSELSFLHSRNSFDNSDNQVQDFCEGHQEKAFLSCLRRRLRRWFSFPGRQVHEIDRQAQDRMAGWLDGLRVPGWESLQKNRVGGPAVSTRNLLFGLQEKVLKSDRT